jgi:hypothetical protein
MKSITSGEHLGNAIVCSTLLKIILLRHLPTLALVLATLILRVTATRDWKSLKMLNGIGISLNVGGTRPTETYRKADERSMRTEYLNMYYKEQVGKKILARQLLPLLISSVIDHAEREEDMYIL